MITKRNLVLLVVIGVLAFVMGRWLTPGSDRQDETTTALPSQDNAVPMIGLSLDSMVIERWHRDVSVMKTRAESLGFSLEVMNSYEDTDKQIEQIRTLIDEGAVALVILPHEKDKLKDVVIEAKKAGIVVISYDRLIDEAPVDAYVSFDNVKVGELMARALLETTPEGNYVIINGAPQDSNAYMIQEGAYKVLQPEIDRGQIRIVHETWAEFWREEFAYNAVNRLMQEGTQIDAILCANDLLAEGAISALSEYGMAGEIPVVGQDANISACQRIVEGKQLMTVYKPIKILSEGSIDLVADLLYGREITTEETIDNGGYQVPYFKFDVTAIDSDNMQDTVIKDFFHSEEDVYRNSDK